MNTRMLPILVTLLAGGCGYQLNPHPTTAEIDSLSTAIQLTSGFTRAGEAYFSPDMKWIVFQATPAGQEHYQMYLAQLKMEMDQIVGTFPPIRISPEDSRNTCGFFSPDGRSLIFASTVGKEDPGLPTAGYQREGRDYRWSYPVGMEIYRADGWAGAISAAEPGKIVNLAQHALTNNLAYDAECSFSPDGKWIVYTSAHRGDLDLYAMRSDGTGIVQLTHTGGYDGGPFFSPDGKKLLYRSDRAGNDLLQIYTADIVKDSTGNIVGIENEQQLTNDKNVNWGPFWHPSGKHIIYATSAIAHTNYELFLMRADGTRKTRITFTEGADVLPVFSPDGRYLLWSSKRNGQTTQIYVAKFKLPEGA